jgi:pyridoxal 5'-phosphate synthase pdxS subunit
VQAVTHYNDPQVLLQVSEGLGDAMHGLDIAQLDEKELLQTRGW